MKRGGGLPGGVEGCVVAGGGGGGGGGGDSCVVRVVDCDPVEARSPPDELDAEVSFDAVVFEVFDESDEEPEQPTAQTRRRAETRRMMRGMAP